MMVGLRGRKLIGNRLQILYISRRGIFLVMACLLRVSRGLPGELQFIRNPERWEWQVTWPFA